MIIKVCGMRDRENIRAVYNLDINMMGFVFYKESPRYVRMISSRAGIIPDYSEDQYAALRTRNAQSYSSANYEGTRRVGVFVDDMPQNIVTRVYNHRLHCVQLHGNESAVACRNLRSTLDPDICPGVCIIKAISVSNADDLKRCEEYAGAVDMFLFDTRCSEKGGSGRQFDWSLLASYNGDIPFLLSGGIGPQSIPQINAFAHPQWAGIDLNSCFETEPGVKDVKMLADFIEELRNSNPNFKKTAK